jgi:hypothetical protein
MLQDCISSSVHLSLSYHPDFISLKEKLMEKIQKNRQDSLIVFPYYQHFKMNNGIGLVLDKNKNDFAIFHHFHFTPNQNQSYQSIVIDDLYSPFLFDIDQIYGFYYVTHEHIYELDCWSKLNAESVISYEKKEDHYSFVTIKLLELIKKEISNSFLCSEKIEKLKKLLDKKNNINDLQNEAYLEHLYQHFTTVQQDRKKISTAQKYAQIEF